MRTDQPTNIIQISAHYPPHLGGLERVTEEIAKHLASSGHSVTVISSDVGAKNAPRMEISANLTVKRLRSFEFAHTPFIPGLLWQLLRVEKPAIFHLHLAQAYTPEMVWLASKIRRIPYVVHFHLDVEPSGKFGFIFVWWKRWVQPVIIKDAAQVITLSPDQSILIQTRYHKPNDQIIFIGNGVAEKFLELGRVKRTFHAPLRLLFVGRLALQKRVDRLVEAMALIESGITLDIVGDGEDRTKLETLAAQNNSGNIRFHGRLEGAGLLNIYRNSDIFVLPSDREGMPLVLLEAMATGLPIIGSDVIGINELIRDVGILVKNPSPITFAEAIKKISHEPQELRALSSASFKKAEEFSWEKLVKKLEIVYKDIASP
jgi:glycosyltransferase involved in cell wall biosynthesis